MLKNYLKYNIHLTGIINYFLIDKKYKYEWYLVKVYIQICIVSFSYAASINPQGPNFNFDDSDV